MAFFFGFCMSFIAAALYQFVDLPDYADLQAPLLACCEQHGVRGTLLLAAEGINGTIAGTPEAVHAVLAFLRSDVRLANLEHKESPAHKMPFYRMKVRLKKEIVTLGVPAANPALLAGQYVASADWNHLLQATPGLVLVDTRNDYEVAIGTFAGAVNPATRSFSELPAWVEAQTQPGGVLATRDDGSKPPVAMFCTGGIRCEKSTALLRLHGFDEVYHLQGGILKYLEKEPLADSLWQGECFVFDERVSVGPGLQAGTCVLCRSCRNPLTEADCASPLHEAGVSCVYCHGLTTEAQKQGYRQRERQIALANSRNAAPHIGPRRVEPGN